MPEYTGMCICKQNSEYTSGPKYAKILNLAGLAICESYAAFWICQNMPWQISEYILGSKHARILGYSRNMAEFWIYKSYTGL